ncbi:hypothetical protein, partial [Bacteroides fragilis]|uniref:hypothetical protein n=2 Tax=Bacteroides TaxID=816 RepID=UPI0038CDBBDF
TFKRRKKGEPRRHIIIIYRGGILGKQGGGGFIRERGEEGFLIELRRKIGNLALTLLMRLGRHLFQGRK